MIHKDAMTPKERFLAVLRGQKPDRLPVYYRATEEAHKKLMTHLGFNDEAQLFDRLHIDQSGFIEPDYIGAPVGENMDIFGCTYADIEYPGGSYRECCGHPLARFQTAEEIRDNYTWPDADWFDYSTIAAQLAGKDEYPVWASGWEPFLRYKYMRGEQQAFIDLIDNPAIVEFCMEKLFLFFYEKTARTLEQARGKVLLYGMGEDLGSQSSLLYSPEHIRTYFLPLHKRMIDMAHQAGCYVSFHSDGAIRKILPDLIELGVDLLDPIQWRCDDMERAALKRDFGGRLVLHGGMDNQFTLPFGTVVDVRQEVLDNIRLLGYDGRYVLGPCHNIQYVGPAENIVAMYDTAYEHGRYA